MAGELILVVDDEERVASMVSQYLTTDGFRTLRAADGETAIALAEKHSPDLILLDVMMPGRDGWSVLQELRATGTTPVIMLTARVDENDKLLGLELGADDYITKPFSLRELAARIRTVLRRTRGTAGPQPEDELLEYGLLRIDAGAAEVTVDGATVSLTPTEFRILATLARRPGRIFSRAQLIEVVMGTYYEGYERSIDTHMSNLRKKLEPDPSSPRWLLTVHGLGYKFARG